MNEIKLHATTWYTCRQSEYYTQQHGSTSCNAKRSQTHDSHPEGLHLYKVGFLLLLLLFWVFFCTVNLTWALVLARQV